MKGHCLLLPFIFLTSCATVTRGPNENLSVLSEPSGAAVKLSSGETGVTPARFVKSRKGNFTVTVSKTGYDPQTIQVGSRFSGLGGAAMAGNVVIGGIVGIGIDAVSGATLSLEPNPVSVHLVPRGGSQPTASVEGSRTPEITPPEDSPWLGTEARKKEQHAGHVVVTNAE
jgi:hypothetical protein